MRTFLCTTLIAALLLGPIPSRLPETAEAQEVVSSSIVLYGATMFVVGVCILGLSRSEAADYAKDHVKALGSTFIRALEVEIERTPATCTLEEPREAAADATRTAANRPLDGTSTPASLVKRYLDTVSGLLLAHGIDLGPRALRSESDLAALRSEIAAVATPSFIETYQRIRDLYSRQLSKMLGQTQAVALQRSSANLMRCMLDPDQLTKLLGAIGLVGIYPVVAADLLINVIVWQADTRPPLGGGGLLWAEVELSSLAFTAFHHWIFSYTGKGFFSVAKTLYNGFFECLDTGQAPAVDAFDHISQYTGTASLFAQTPVAVRDVLWVVGIRDRTRSQ